jgi:uncharacterized protein YutE (UPF0331/DUF86 family)
MSTPLVFDEDVILAKTSIISSCTKTIREMDSQPMADLEERIRRDVQVLNLQRAAQACLDLGNHLISQNEWDLPRDAGHVMTILRDHQVVSSDLEQKMRSVQGFRNVAVHRYTELDPDILRAIVDHHLADLEEFSLAIRSKTISFTR